MMQREYVRGSLIKLLEGFINGLKKSFSGEDYLREINTCRRCGKPCFFDSCLTCEVDEAYRGWERTGKL